MLVIVSIDSLAKGAIVFVQYVHGIPAVGKCTSLKGHDLATHIITELPSKTSCILILVWFL